MNKTFFQVFLGKKYFGNWMLLKVLIIQFLSSYVRPFTIIYKIHLSQEIHAIDFERIAKVYKNKKQ